jgi:hypothetical protein
MQDALRRLMTSKSLGETDYDDLFALLFQDAGIPDIGERKAIPLSEEHLPSNASADRVVKLLTLKDLKNVNRIAEEQELHTVQWHTFRPTLDSVSTRFTVQTEGGITPAIDHQIASRRLLVQV